MPNNCCSVPGCAHRGGHAFPTDKKRCKAWVIAIRRSEEGGGQWWPTVNSVVCRSHFQPTDYKENNLTGCAPGRRILKSTAVPIVFPWSKSETPGMASRGQRAIQRNTKRHLAEAERNRSMASDDMTVTADGLPEEILIIHDVLNMDPKTEINTESNMMEVMPRTDQGQQTDSLQCVNTQTQTIESTPVYINRITVNDFKDDCAGFQFYTGLDSCRTFNDVFASLGPAVYQLNYLYGIHPTISVEDQLFLSIIKCRQYKTNFELSRMFKISETDVYSIFVTWIRFMCMQWREIDIWPERDVVQFYSPSDFKQKYPTTRAVFDGFEHPVKKPRNPAAQQVTFSTYKNRNTSKVIVGVTPGGMCSYLSDAYGGSTSDRQIIERSNVVERVNKGDSIMADKGFDVQDIFAPKDVTVNIPTFFKKKNRMTGQTVMRDRKISSKRVHVERVIGLGKTYKILCNPLNHTESLLATDITFVCFMLTNFRRCIVPKTA